MGFEGQSGTETSRKLYSIDHVGKKMPLNCSDVCDWQGIWGSQQIDKGMCQRKSCLLCSCSGATDL